MEPRGHGRHCLSCDRVVIDLTRATPTQALGYAALFGSGGRLCGRLRVDAEGDAILRREPTREPTRERPGRRFGLAVATALGSAACGSATPDLRGAAMTEPSPAITEVVVDPVVARGPAPELAPSGAPMATECPRTKPVVHVTAVDRDGDGVSDDDDKCPDQAGQGAPDGCPKLVAVEMLGDIDIVQRVQFASQSSVIAPASVAIIDATADVMKSSPTLTVKVTGHADGTEAGPDALGLARANAVIGRLVSLGVDPKRLTATTKGSSMPIAPNATPADRERNRRVEFELQ